MSHIMKKEFPKLGQLKSITTITGAVLVPDFTAPTEGVRAEKLILGHFITMDEMRPEAEAMTVVGDKIQYIGSADVALTLCDANTAVMDYNNSYLYPGFLEAHCHPRGAGQALIGSVKLRSGVTLEDYIEMMRKDVEEHPDKDLYNGAGFIVQGVNPTAAMLDAICPDKPMILGSEDGHSVWVNTVALKMFDITPELAKKVGPKQIRVDADGNPTGYISEGQALRIITGVPLSKKTRMEQLYAWQNFAFSQGYTAASEAALFNDDIEAYQEISQRPDWKLRTYAWYYEDETRNTVEHMVDTAVEAAKLCNSEYMKVVGVKLFMDGVVDAHTAWLTEAYTDQPGNFGVQRNNDVPKLTKAVVLTNKEGMNLHIHAIGDGAVKTAMDAVEAGQKITGNYDQRNAFAHLQLVRPEDVKRIAENNVVALVAPLWAPYDFGKYAEKEIAFLGQARNDVSHPTKCFRDQGGVIAFHTDFPVSPEMNIPGTIYNAVNRYSAEQGPRSLRGEDQRLTRREALLAMTRSVAYMWHEESRLGTLELGKIANLSIYDTDFMNAPLEDVAQAKLVATVVDGDVVFEA